MISFNTTRFGLLTVDETKIIHFPEGIPGFTDLKRYILIDHRDTVLKWLQAIDDPDVAFIVVEPHYLDSNYKINIDDNIRHFLDLVEEENLAILVILRREGENIIANFNSPLLLNAETMRGIQVLLE
ncbi:MAG: flagellar assembly protein FliW [Thermodesulfovibrionales bacterium]|nr:flagellar assembly protein FliW [Thermodesulfovibrionales bacterium]